MSTLFASGGASGALRGTLAVDAPRPRLVVSGAHHGLQLVVRCVHHALEPYL